MPFRRVLAWIHERSDGTVDNELPEGMPPGINNDLPPSASTKPVFPIEGLDPDRPNNGLPGHKPIGYPILPIDPDWGIPEGRPPLFGQWVPVDPGFGMPPIFGFSPVDPGFGVPGVRPDNDLPEQGRPDQGLPGTGRPDNDLPGHWVPINVRFFLRCCGEVDREGRPRVAPHWVWIPECGRRFGHYYPRDRRRRRPEGEEEVDVRIEVDERRRRADEERARRP